MLAKVWGLWRPRGGWLGWACDRHFLIALMLAWPVWAGLFLLPGGWVQAPSEPRIWLSLLVFQPFVEELLFRGLLQGYLRREVPIRLSNSISLANLLTALLFALAHLVRQPLWMVLALFVPGMVIGHMRDRFGSILPGLCLHSYYNAGLFACAWLFWGAS